MTDKCTKVYDEQGNFLGVFIGPDLWSRIEGEIAGLLPSLAPAPVIEKPEPLGDWATLREFWDFRYPVDTDVRCAVCGNSTEDWQKDEPRKFRLIACNMGGLVRFECRGCKARISKRHFKDKITVETKPYAE